MRNRIIPEESKWSPYPVGVLSSIPRDVSFFDERETGKIYPGVLEIGLAQTQATRISEPLDYVEYTIHDLPSDGIPLPIGADECTKPRSAPAASVAVFANGLTRMESIGEPS